VNTLGFVIYAAYIALILFITVAAYYLYMGVRKKNWVVVSIICTIIGVLLLTFSTVGAVPYEKIRTYPIQSTTSVFNETFSMGPNETRSFDADEVFMGSNQSVIQIRIMTSAFQFSGQLSVANQWNTPMPVLNFTVPVGGYGPYGTHYSFYWTPSGPFEDNPLYSSDWSPVDHLTVTFHNLDNSSVRVQMQTDIFDKTSGEVDTLTYHPLIDFQFIYAGLCIIGIALIPEGYAVLRKKTE
jgi:hypothetical protein